MNLITWLFIKIIWLYQLLISPWLGQNKCRFMPSCSNYANEALTTHGLKYGLFLIIKRIISCNPWWGKYGIDLVPDKITFKKNKY